MLIRQVQYLDCSAVINGFASDRLEIVDFGADVYVILHYVKVI